MGQDLASSQRDLTFGMMTWEVDNGRIPVIERFVGLEFERRLLEESIGEMDGRWNPLQMRIGSA